MPTGTTRRALAEGMDSDLAVDTTDRKPIAVRVGRALLIVALAVSVAAVGWSGLSHSERRSVRISDSGLPMVASDYLAQGADHRILALHATSNNTVEYTVMRSARGDLIDSSPAQRVRLAVNGPSDTAADSDTTADSGATGTQSSTNANRILAQAAAKLLAGSDAQSIHDISQLGFGGLFVAVEPSDDADSAAQRLVSNVTASDGTQSVVAADNGTYYRLTINSADSQNIDTSWQRRTQSSHWRYAWLICLGVVVALYCLVALPHRTYRYSGEEA